MWNFVKTVAAVAVGIWVYDRFLAPTVDVEAVEVTPETKPEDDK